MERPNAAPVAPPPSRTRTTIELPSTTLSSATTRRLIEIRPSASKVASTNRKKPWASTAIEIPRSGHSAPGASKASVIGPARANRSTETGTAANALSRIASPSTAVDGGAVVATLGEEARGGARDAHVGEERRHRADRHRESEVAIDLRSELAAQEEGDERGDRGGRQPA